MIIGISGRMRHGKDVIAQRLLHRWGFAVLPFAASLKEEVFSRLPRTLRFLHGLSCDCPGTPECIRRLIYVTKPPGVRELLQEYGTEVRRQDDMDYWTKLWRAAAGKYARAVAPDARFFNEGQAVKDAGGILWRVVRPGLESASGLHGSETGMDAWPSWDAVLINDGSIEDLWAKVDQLALGLNLEQKEAA